MTTIILGFVMYSLLAFTCIFIAAIWVALITLAVKTIIGLFE